jgi:hypothetical protein
MPKLSDSVAFPEATSLTDDALIYAVDNSGVTPTSKAIELQFFLAQVKNYGSMSVADNTTNQTLTASTWTKVDAFDTAAAAHQKGVTATTGAAHTLVPDRLGKYKVTYSLCVKAVAGNTEVKSVVYMDSTAESQTQSVQKVASGYTAQMGGTAVIDVTDLSGTAGDFSIWIHVDNTSVRVSDAQFFIERIDNT